MTLPGTPPVCSAGSMTGVFTSASLGPVRLRNRIIKAATFEGMATHGLVTDRLIDFHRTVAAGGVGGEQAEAVDEDRALLHPAEHPMVAIGDAAHVVVVADAHHHVLAVLRRLARRGARDRRP